MWKKIEESAETGNEHYLLSTDNTVYKLYRTTRNINDPIEDDYMIEKYDKSSDTEGMINKDGQFVFGWGVFNAIGPNPNCHWPLREAKYIVANLVVKECNNCDCQEKYLDWQKKQKEMEDYWNNLSQEEKDKEIAEVQENLAKVANDPNLTIITGGHTFCECDCHKGLSNAD